MKSSSFVNKFQPYRSVLLWIHVRFLSVYCSIERKEDQFTSVRRLVRHRFYFYFMDVDFLVRKTVFEDFFACDAEESVTQQALLIIHCIF